jgi:hypothetical protein
VDQFSCYLHGFGCSAFHWTSIRSVLPLRKIFAACFINNLGFWTCTYYFASIWAFGTLEFSMLHKFQLVMVMMMLMLVSMMMIIRVLKATILMVRLVVMEGAMDDEDWHHKIQKA